MTYRIYTDILSEHKGNKISKKKKGGVGVTSVHLIITNYFFLFVINFSNLTNILAQ